MKLLNRRRGSTRVIANRPLIKPVIIPQNRWTSKAPSKVLLLDLDGVVIPPCPQVARSIERYTSRHCNMSLETSALLNLQLYRQYGHSYVGLKKLFNISHTLDEFNEEVYEDVHNSINLTDWLRTKANASVESAAKTIELLSKQNIPTYIFSNAPPDWCKQVLLITGLSKLVAGRITCQLKPELAVYKQTEKALYNTYGTNDIDIVFVDDSFTNIVPVLQAEAFPRWTPYLFDASAPKDVTDIAHVLEVIHRLPLLENRIKKQSSLVPEYVVPACVPL